MSKWGKALGVFARDKKVLPQVGEDTGGAIQEAVIEFVSLDGVEPGYARLKLPDGTIMNAPINSVLRVIKTLGLPGDTQIACCLPGGIKFQGGAVDARKMMCCVNNSTTSAPIAAGASLLDTAAAPAHGAAEDNITATDADHDSAAVGTMGELPLGEGNTE